MEESSDRTSSVMSSSGNNNKMNSDSGYGSNSNKSNNSQSQRRLVVYIFSVLNDIMSFSANVNVSCCLQFWKQQISSEFRVQWQLCESSWCHTCHVS